MNFKEELKRFKPSMEVDEIEDAVMKMDLTDMNDIMFQMMEKTVSEKTAVKDPKEEPLQ
ncbi:MAG: hypothetical protein MJ059_03830 [Lachnospiraceae bacterium]|nr:hypothetical protein [Lachnospiraceae bacterium]